MVGHGPLLLVGDVRADCGAAERSVSVLLLPDLVPAVGLHALAQVSVRLQFFLGGSAMDAEAGVPGAVSLHVSHSESFSLKLSVVHSLTKVLNLAELVLGNGFMVLNRFLDDNRLGEGLVVSLGMD